MAQAGSNNWNSAAWPELPEEQNTIPDPEENLRSRRIQAYLRGEILDPLTEAEGTEVKGEAEVVHRLFTDEELQEWTGEGAVSWILAAKNAFEILGIPVSVEPDVALLRLRYRKLSLLVHPDKNPRNPTEASDAFQRLSEASRVLIDDTERQSLLNTLEAEASEGKDFAVNQHVPEEQHEEPEASEEALNESFQKRVLQHGKLQQLLRQKRRKTTHFPVRGAGAASAGGRSSLTEQWQRMAAAAAPAPAVPTAPMASTHVPYVQDVSASPESSWQQGGDAALKMAGWRRLESRRVPGQFYFAHLATGHTVMQASSSRPIQSTEHVWERRQSRHDPSVHYYVNTATGETRMEGEPTENIDKRGQSLWYSIGILIFAKFCRRQKSRTGHRLSYRPWFRGLLSVCNWV